MSHTHTRTHTCSSQTVATAAPDAVRYYHLYLGDDDGFDSVPVVVNGGGSAHHALDQPFVVGTMFTMSPRLGAFLGVRFTRVVPLTLSPNQTQTQPTRCASTSSFPRMRLLAAGPCFTWMAMIFPATLVSATPLTGILAGGVVVVRVGRCIVLFFPVARFAHSPHLLAAPSFQSD